MEIKLPKKVIEIITVLEDKDYEIYVVGGAVRDLLQGKTAYDWDFTTNAKPEEILKLFPDAFYDNKFGTVGIPGKEDERLSEPGGSSPNRRFVRTGGPSQRPYEITTFRTEHGYSDTRRPDKVEWGKSLDEDLKRRDLTINAMAIKIKNPNSTKKVSNVLDVELIDPYSGQKDLKKKLIRAVGDANERFSEDALRMMRAIRIASELGFDIEKKTKKAIKDNATLIGKIAKERIRDELLKTLASDHPYKGIVSLRETGLMQEIIPELEKTFGVEQASPGRHHIYDVGTHSMNSLKAVAERNTNAIVRLATLIHDIGKPQTYKKLKSGTITFYNHEVVSGKIAKRIAERLRFSKKQKEKLYKLVRFHQFTVDENQTDSAIRRFIRKVGKENVPDMLDLRVGDRLGGGARETSWRLEEYKERLIEVQKQPFTVHDLKISGNEVMETLNLKPGPKVGEILKELYDKVVDKKIPNEKVALLNELKNRKE